MTYQLRKATKIDLGRCWEIISQATLQMLKEKKHQWDETYPTIEHILTDIDSENAYVLCDSDNQIVVYGAVVFSGEPSYKIITGKWLSEQEYVVVHRLAVAKEMRGLGLATFFLEKVEEVSIEKGIHSFKIDTNYDNYSMQQLLKKCGFTYCGDIIYLHGARLAYEKLLK